MSLAASGAVCLPVGRPACSPEQCLLQTVFALDAATAGLCVTAMTIQTSWAVLLISALTPGQGSYPFDMKNFSSPSTSAWPTAWPAASKESVQSGALTG